MRASERFVIRLDHIPTCLDRVLDSFPFIPHCPPMSDHGGESIPAPAVPWLDELTVLALRGEFQRQVAAGRDAHTTRRAVRDLAIGLHPSLPFPMLEDFAAATLLCTEGG
ncbi:hypothetical protein KPL78_00985 [Roseomonas sp. HJA6]|uniref:Uncharacterized protein n=1 Tax=Roseomonas alba TaxID=2846776 RepID=A0ABS7A4Y8_9PROT|nr:hypothetical protein [Neoroseomonas alba]MBW6396395.1 hypothetical protein [Neoroseomonas alba]